MKILGGLFNLQNIVDRVIGNDSWAASIVSQTAADTEELANTNASGDELYRIKGIHISVRCRTLPTTTANFRFSVYFYDGATQNTFMQGHISELAVDEVFNYYVPVDMIFGDGLGMKTSVRGNGTGGLYDTRLQMHYERISK